MAQSLKTASLVIAAALMGSASYFPLRAQEVLPWANTPPVAAAAPVEDADPAVAAALAQCSGLFEGACRDLKTCAWVADVALGDGTIVPARCVARPPAPPKSAAKKSQPSKPKETGATAPAVKAAEIRAEPESDAAKKKSPAVTETPPPKAEAKVTPPSEPEAPPAPEAKKAAAPEPPAPSKAPPVTEAVKVEPPAAEPEAKKPPAKAAAKEAEPKAEQAEKKEEPAPQKKEAEKKQPPAQAGPRMPSFGSISPIMPGGGGAIVVTVPPPASSE